MTHLKDLNIRSREARFRTVVPYEFVVLFHDFDDGVAWEIEETLREFKNGKVDRFEYDGTDVPRSQPSRS